MNSVQVIVSGDEFHEYNDSIANACKSIGLSAHDHTYWIGHNGTLPMIARCYLSKMPGVGRKNPASGYCESLFKVVKEHHPEVLVIIKGHLLLEGTLSRIREICPHIKIALWVLDSVQNISFYNGIWNDIDVLALFEESDLELDVVKQFPNCITLPIGYDPSKYYPDQKDPEYDIVFCGFPYPWRMGLLRNLAKEASVRGWRFGIVGNVYRKLPFARFRFAKREPLLYSSLITRKLSPLMVNQLYNRSVAVLNMHHPQSKTGFNPRTVEILGAGACQLLDHRETLHHLFPDRECVLYYGSFKDLMERIDELLSDRELQSTLRNNAPLFAHNHTYSERIKKLLRYLDFPI